MNQGDRCWYYAPGPLGAVRRVAMCVGLFDGEDRERVNLFVFPTSSRDVSHMECDAVPVRHDHTDGAPVDTPFCTPLG